MNVMECHPNCSVKITKSRGEYFMRQTTSIFTYDVAYLRVNGFQVVFLYKRQ